jgi:hypothetical protein
MRARESLKSIVLRVPLLRQLLFLRQEAHARACTSSRALEALTRDVWKQCQGRIVSGPFAGMRYVMSSHGSMLLPKLLGVYELELWDAIESFIQCPPASVVDIGAAEGYYAGGLAFRMGTVPIVAYESSLKGRRQLCKLVEQNQFATFVKIEGTATMRSLSRHITDGCQIICDVEGAEVELLDPVKIPALRQATILFEGHDTAVPGTGDRVAGRFFASHSIEKINSRARRAEDWPEKIALDLKLWPHGPAAALNEFRHHVQSWFILRPLER